MEDSRPFFTIGIPVYNAEKYITKLLNSIINQKFDKFEVICIDDASSDSSYELLKEYAKKERRIHVFRNEYNMGIAKTRRNIVSHAHGSFFLWADADDLITPDSLISLYEFYKVKENVNNIVIHNAYIEDKGKKVKLYSFREGFYDIKEIQMKMLVSNQIKSYPWSIVGKIDYYKNVSYPENVKDFVDDQLISYQYLNNAEKVYFLDSINYIHILYNLSDSHNSSFYFRLSNTYRYLYENISVNHIDVKKALKMMEFLSLAFYYSKKEAFSEDKRYENYTKFKAVKKKLKTCKVVSIKNLSKLGKREIMQVLLLRYYGKVFFTYYNKRRML